VIDDFEGPECECGASTDWSEELKMFVCCSPDCDFAGYTLEEAERLLGL